MLADTCVLLLVLLTRYAVFPVLVFLGIGMHSQLFYRSDRRWDDRRSAENAGIPSNRQLELPILRRRECGHLGYAAGNLS